MKLNKKLITILLTISLFSLGIKFSISCAQNPPGLSLEQLQQIYLTTLEIIKNFYVDEVNFKKVIEGGIQGMLNALDPHSNYIPPEKAEEFKTGYSQEFIGIGISYDILEGILTVISPIESSPASKAGIRAGDKIIKINGESIIGIDKEKAKDKLQGEIDSPVTLTIERSKEKIFDVEVVRDTVHSNSVPYYYLINDSIGYIRIITYAEKTAEELEFALDTLEGIGMKKLILDLRGNSGGLLDQTVLVTSKFLETGDEIVAIKGRNPDFDQIYKSQESEKHRYLPLIVAIDHGTASASEITAGAIQDWDRGLIVGERSFGKGLVQRQFPLGYGASALITIAKYHTPSGRLIQRDYSKGVLSYYSENIDSIDHKQKKDDTENVYYTSNKRKVYGGGGINPDIKIEWADPISCFEEIFYHEKRPLFEFVNRFCKKNYLLKNDFENFLTSFKIDSAQIKAFKSFLRQEEICVDDSIPFNSSLFNAYFRREIALNFWGQNKADQVYHYNHPDILKIIDLFKESETVLGEYH